MSANDSTPDGNATPANGNEHSGRDANGRFARGNPGGPGNPYARKVAELRKAIVEVITEEDVREIVGVLKEKAKAGSTAAIKLLFQYAIGKPGPDTDPDQVHLDDWQPLREASRLREKEEGVVPGPPLETKRGGTLPASSGSVTPAGSFPAGLVDRMALGGLGVADVSVLGNRPPSPNGEIGAR